MKQRCIYEFSDFLPGLYRRIQVVSYGVSLINSAFVLIKADQEAIEQESLL